jgi:hypothetical protein
MIEKRIAIPKKTVNIIKEEVNNDPYNLIGLCRKDKRNRYHIHHLIHYYNHNKITDDINHPDNLIALNMNQHDIIHHQDDDSKTMLLSMIFSFHPRKHLFIRRNGYNIHKLILQ